jgi:hypothetical protein
MRLRIKLNQINAEFIEIRIRTLLKNAILFNLAGFSEIANFSI